MRKLSQILIIDDDPLTSYLHKVLLQKFGVSHQIETVTDGYQAIQLIKKCIQSKNEEQIPQLIFLEVDMPLARGNEFLEAYKDLEFINKDSVVVAVLTCSVSRKQTDCINEFPINDYIVKPLTKKRMMGLMNKHFS